MEINFEHVQITVTLNEEEAAQRIAASVVEQRLAACAQVVGPIHSTFRWQGSVKRAVEWYCLVKTTPSRIGAIVTHVEQNYLSDTPEIVAIPLVGGSAAYLEWIAAESRAV